MSPSSFETRKLITSARNGKQKGTRHNTKRNLNIPYWNTNNQGKRLPKNWRRTLSIDSKPGSPYYYKVGGANTNVVATTWQNPNQYPNPVLQSINGPSTPPGGNTPVGGPGTPITPALAARPPPIQIPAPPPSPAAPAAAPAPAPAPAATQRKPRGRKAPAPAPAPAPSPVPATGAQTPVSGTGNKSGVNDLIKRIENLQEYYGPLPDGWEKHAGRKKGIFYYENPAKKISQYNRPLSTNNSWVVKTSSGSKNKTQKGSIYYENRTSKDPSKYKSQWNRPAKKGGKRKTRRTRR